jgi:hypothetical protein
VIDAFNSNLPYDQFITDQLAGDLLPNATLDQKIATGFNRNHHITTEGGAVEEEYRVEYVNDRVQTTSTTFLGLTMRCARCHDHKYDPITQKDYYSFFAFFNNVPEQGVPAYKPNEGVIAPSIPAPTKSQQAELARLAGHQPEIDKLKATFPQTMIMQEMPTPRQTHVLRRGEYDKPGDVVTAAVPACFTPLPAGVPANRLALAHWMTDPANPLVRSGQSTVAIGVWNGTGRNRRGFWHAGGTAEPSGIARLARHDIHSRRMGHQGNVAANGDEQHVSPVIQCQRRNARP